MSDDHIGVKINGVLYVKLEDARRLREGWDRADERIDEQAAEITRLRAELATAQEYRDALNEALASRVWLNPIQDDETPKDALRRLIGYETAIERLNALDPSLSQDAADLVATARRDALAEIKQDTDELIEQGRQDGMEKAAQIADATAHANRFEYLKKWKDRPEGIPHDWSVAWETCAETAEEIAAAIRAAAGEGK